MHITLRARAGLRSLRSARVFSVVQASLRAASSAAFRVLEFSVQADHVHLIVEASNERALSSGARGLAIRIARAINRELGRRGPVWGDRYHARPLRTPREVRNALVYVLMNWKKHPVREPWQHGRSTAKLDPCSSAPWFDGFRTPAPVVAAPAVTRPPHTWLARIGWRRRGLIDPAESPLPTAG